MANGWTTMSSGSTSLSVNIPRNNYFGLAVGNNGNLVDVVFSNVPPTTPPICFVGDVKVLCEQGIHKTIKDIQIGDNVVTNIEKNHMLKVANIYKSFVTTNGYKLKKGLIGNFEDIICTNHPFWCNDDKNRIFPEYIGGVESYALNEYIYDLQFEEESVFYVNGKKVDALSPNYIYFKLPKEKYYDMKKYEINKHKIIYGDTDNLSFRGKPPMTQILLNI